MGLQKNFQICIDKRSKIKKKVWARNNMKNLKANVSGKIPKFIQKRTRFENPFIHPNPSSQRGQKEGSHGIDDIEKHTRTCEV